MGKLFKRRRNPHVYSSSQMLATLAELDLVALLQHSSIWLAVDPRTAWLLDMCCTGQMEGGPGTAQEVAQQLGLALPPTPLPPPPSLFSYSIGKEHASAAAQQEEVSQPQMQC